jgi:hypothetical protein
MKALPLPVCLEDWLHGKFCTRGANYHPSDPRNPIDRGPNRELAGIIFERGQFATTF